MKLICTWPDGSKREVILGQDTASGLARVAWNESHAPMGELGCVCGLEDERLKPNKKIFTRAGNGLQAVSNGNKRQWKGWIKA